ncbi:MAG: MarR family winged helix-turn-helix transcriptional regulator [Nocardioides sp.]
MASVTASSALDLSGDLVVYAARLIRLMKRTQDLPAGTRMLSLLDEYGPLGITALAHLDGCSQPTMSAAVANLVDAGLVSKHPNPNDARGCVITLTDAGSQRLNDVRAQHAQTVAARLGSHDLDDLATAVAVLRDLLDSDETDTHS